MIEQTVEALTPVIGTRPACRALGAAPATIYRRRRPPTPRRQRPRPTPARALSEAERAIVVGELCSERFVDCSPAQVWATLLDEGRYLASERTMYRILAGQHGAVRERRDQLTHPAYAAPELLAERPNELWSWDITKLLGPAKWTYFYLYVILDVFSRYAVAWTIAHRESAELAKALIAQATEQQQIAPGTLTVHADRGSSMTSKPVAFLLADLGVLKSHSRPYTSTDNPLLRSALQDAQVSARVPRALRDHRAGAGLRSPLLRLVQPPPSPFRDRPHDPGRRSLRPRRRTPRRTHARPATGLRPHARTVRPPRTHTAAAPDRGMDQQARQRRGRSLNLNVDRLIRLDRLRAGPR